VRLALATALWPVALGISPWESPAPARGPQPGGTGGTGIRSLLVSILSMVNLGYLPKNKNSILDHFSWFGLTLRADTIVCPRNQRPQHAHVLLSFRLQGWGASCLFIIITTMMILPGPGKRWRWTVTLPAKD